MSGVAEVEAPVVPSRDAHAECKRAWLIGVLGQKELFEGRQNPIQFKFERVTNDASGETEGYYVTATEYRSATVGTARGTIRRSSESEVAFPYSPKKVLDALEHGFGAIRELQGTKPVSATEQGVWVSVEAIDALADQALKPALGTPEQAANRLRTNLMADLLPVYMGAGGGF